MNKEILLMRILSYFLFLHLTHSQLQINLYLTEWISHGEKNNDLQHDCLHVIIPFYGSLSFGQLVSYCMGEWPSKWNIQENKFDPKFTFVELSKRNITSQQLYSWSAPMDIVEKYQFYLNQSPNSEKTSMATHVLYNCTLPNFGPKCEYTLNDYKPHHQHLSLYELVHDYSCSNGYEPTTLTCYTHLQCNHGPSPSCLDWTEICDGKVDCLNGGHDEEHCWQLEINQCNENEYRCRNGQCIPQRFFDDEDILFDCLDQSDEPRFRYTDLFLNIDSCITPKPLLLSDDVSCIIFPDMSWNILTSSCTRNRPGLLLTALFSVKPKSVSDECWTAFKCIIDAYFSADLLCATLCFDGICDKIVRITCPDLIYASAVPILSGHVFLVYENNNLKYGSYEITKSMYVCYNDQLLYLSGESKTRQLPDNNTCRPYASFEFYSSVSGYTSIITHIFVLNMWLQRLTSGTYNSPLVCNQSTTYQCINSYKCISKSHLFDSFPDCFYGDDEDLSLWDKNCSIKQNLKFFKCETTNECIPLRFVKDGICHCKIYNVDNSYQCDDEAPEYHSDKTEINFFKICDKLTHLYPIMIDGQNHTDETECDQWPCNNIYTHCDGFWNCLNGADELNCDSPQLLNCSSNNHICLSLETNKPMCLPIEKANDGIVDCIGAADEPTRCRPDEYSDPIVTFYCGNSSSLSCINVTFLCDKIPHCADEEDEQICTSNDFKNYQMDLGICGENYQSNGSDIAKTLCKVFYPNIRRHEKKYFKLGEIQSSSEGKVTHLSSRISPRQSMIQTIQYYQQRCHRGLDIQVWLNKEKNLTTSACLCPPSFYGDICQFQNQRVSITIEFRTTTDSVHIPFIIIVSLIDNSEQRTIHSYEQFTTLAKYQCRGKFHAYLLYSIRPKNQTYNYSIHVDIFEKISLTYRGSVIKPILFPFLPIHRLSFLMNIPGAYENIDSCFDSQCINGKCRRYFNDPNNTTFCQCNTGWSGRYCTIQHTCTCSLDSLCIGMLANNRSLCVCALNKIGDRCLLNNTLCDIDPHKKCLNGGQCMVFNEYRTVDKQFICICPKGYVGERCEAVQPKIIFSFDKNIVLSSSMRIHFISSTIDYPFQRRTTFKTIPPGETSITIYSSYAFDIIIVELLPKNYYFIFLQKQYLYRELIEIPIYPSNHCLHVNELFNSTIVNYHRLRRIKYYHIPCQTNRTPPLSCFYDDISLCLCQDHGHQRVANCFEFDHNMNMNCSGRSGCLHGGECFEDDYLCPQETLCICPLCYYGARCQFNTNGFSLSLDAILGHHIYPNVKISAQSSAVLISLILSVIITFAGIINGVLTLITFKEKKIRDIGCGIYLLWSSINTLFTMIIFTLKIWILVFSQMKSIQNRSLLNFQCFSLDFLLRFGLTMDQWLTTCVAIERTYITIKGVNLNKKKTRLTAKLIIIALGFLAIGTAIHDPINRSLSDEVNGDEEKRTWCIVTYSSAIHIVNLVITIFHIIVPFIINLVAAIIIITMSARQRATVQKKEKYQNLLIEQFQQHKNLLAGPVVLTILAIPRLIIAFASGCMESTSNAWLFLLGYFISLIPLLLTFILFVLPSSVYYAVFSKAVSEYRNVLTMRS